MRAAKWTRMGKELATWFAIFAIINPALTVPALAAPDISGGSVVVPEGDAVFDQTPGGGQTTITVRP